MPVPVARSIAPVKTLGTDGNLQSGQAELLASRLPIAPVFLPSTCHCANHCTAPTHINKYSKSAVCVCSSH